MFDFGDEKKQDDDFDFGDSSAPKTQDAFDFAEKKESADDLFDFGPSDNNDFDFGPPADNSSPFTDYFPSSNPDNAGPSDNTTLLGNSLKDLYNQNSPQ